MNTTLQNPKDSLCLKFNQKNNNKNKTAFELQPKKKKKNKKKQKKLWEETKLSLHDPIGKQNTHSAKTKSFESQK
jgi:hypothetical protein